MRFKTIQDNQAEEAVHCNSPQPVKNKAAKLKTNPRQAAALTFVAPVAGGADKWAHAADPLVVTAQTAVTARTNKSRERPCGTPIHWELTFGERGRGTSARAFTRRRGHVRPPRAAPSRAHHSPASDFH